MRTELHTPALLVVALAACHPNIPRGDRPPYVPVLVDSGFRIAMDTIHVERGPENGWFIWFITTHAKPLERDSLRFDRGRIRLLVRCQPLAFKSVSQDLALGDARPVSRIHWPLSGPKAVGWQVPDSGATDHRFLRAACRLLPRAP